MYASAIFNVVKNHLSSSHAYEDNLQLYTVFVLQVIVDVFPTWCAQSNRSLHCWRSSLDGHQPPKDKR